MLPTTTVDREGRSLGAVAQAEAEVVAVGADQRHAAPGLFLASGLQLGGELSLHLLGEAVYLGDARC